MAGAFATIDLGAVDSEASVFMSAVDVLRWAWKSCRVGGARSLGRAIRDAVPPGVLAADRPEPSWVAERRVQVRGGLRVVLHHGDVEVDLVADVLLLVLRRRSGNEDRRGLVRRLVGEDEPHPPGNAARVCRPGPEVDVPGVPRLNKVRVDALECTSVADDTFDDVRGGGVCWDPVEADAR